MWAFATARDAHVSHTRDIFRKRMCTRAHRDVRNRFVSASQHAQVRQAAFRSVRARPFRIVRRRLRPRCGDCHPFTVRARVQL